MIRAPSANTVRVGGGDRRTGWPAPHFALQLGRQGTDPETGWPLTSNGHVETWLMLMLKRGSMIDFIKKSSCAASVGPFHAVAQCESGVHFMSSRTIRFSAITFAMALGLAIALVGVSRAGAAQPTVGLGTVDSFAILAGTTVTNTGPTTISGNVGVSPGSAVTGFPPGTVTNGTIHAADAVAAQAQSDVTTAYNDAAGRTPCTVVGADLVGRTLVPGVYCGGTLGLTGTVTLDAQGNPDAVFIFQGASTLITASGSNVAVINGAQACNVFWEIGSSATLGTNSVFRGTVLALTSVAAQTGASVLGRLLARNGAVTLDTNTVTSPVCAATTATTTTTPTTTTAPTTTTTTAPTTTTTTAPTTTTTTAPTTTTTTAPTTTTTTA